MYNKALLIGNLTKDVETKYLPSGSAVATLSVAVNSRYKQGDETREEVLFIDCVIFGRSAESCAQYLSKGSPVLVEGRLRERRWEYEGKKHSKMELVTSNVRFLPKRDAGATGQGTSDAEPPYQGDDDGPF